MGPQAERPRFPGPLLYILFAKARGESKKSIVFNHVLKNVSLPAITLQFLSFSELFAGAVFAEQVFSLVNLRRI